MGSDAAAEPAPPGASPSAAASNSRPSLPKLLASLALGARSVNALPIGLEKDGDGDDHDLGDDGGDGEDDDEFSFRMSLPEFASLNGEARRELSSLLCRALEGISLDGGRGGGDDDDDDDDGDGSDAYDFDDPELWERCADACDALYDRVSAYVVESENRANGGDYEALAASAAIDAAGRRARANASGSYGRMLRGVADMEKPQNVYQGFVTNPPQNSRGEPFVPMSLSVAFDSRKRAGLDGGEFTREGHGLDSRYDNGGGGGGDGEGEERDFTRRKYSPDMVAPSFHYDHPYREEITALEYRPWQLDVDSIERSDGPIEIRHDEKDMGVWIDSEDDLDLLVARITEGKKSGEVREIALDLEAHSHRTFAGFVCLIQLSIRRPPPSSSPGDPPSDSSSSPPNVSTGYDFLIDALSLRHAIPSRLGPILADPDVLKVMHGADSDVPWLQRDFGCYVVNLFDTGRASRALKLPSAGLAYLLRKYAGFEADKAHQLSDWRRRPLPDDMRGYAVSDTRYLLDIYDRLRLELEGHSSREVSIESVLDRSRRVCLIRYDKEPFRPSGYLSIMDGRNSRRRRNGKNNARVTSELSSQQEAALKALYDWRDRTARREDESVQYVCPNAALLRIASNRPATVAALGRLVNPLPPLVMRRSQEILDAIRASAASVPSSSGPSPAEGDAGRTDSAKPATDAPPAPPSSNRNREMLSPILGSEALYRQAGWMTPTVPDGASRASESEEDEGVRKFLDVNAANEGYASTHHSSHSIDMSPPLLETDSEAAAEGGNEAKRSRRGRSTDGLGTARAVLGNGEDVSIKEDARVAQRSADLIQKEMAKVGEGRAGKFGKGFSLIDLIRPLPPSEDIDLEKSPGTGGDGNDPAAEALVEEDEMAIPKSMREIYNLSNANRRRTGKEKAGNKPLQFPGDAPENIERFEEDGVQGAEAVIASRGGPGGYFGGGTGKRQRTAPGKDGDVKLMTKLGWVKDKKDAESLAAVSAEGQVAAEKDKHGHGPHSKKGGSGGGRGGGTGGGGGGSFDYYASMGAGMGAFDPNAAPSKNPFFAGAATGAASMLHGESKGKSQKRNKKR